MKKRLFLTGPMGCGKSTAIAQALGSTACRGGGFFTRRQLDSSGKLTGFSLESPDGARGEVFLDFTQGKPVWNLSVFSQLGRDLLTDPDAPFLVLDEIGGVELLCPEFADALEAVFVRGTPCIGVMKGAGPSGALIKALGLDDTYAHSWERLQAFLSSDPDTLLYSCGQFDKHALALACQWVQEYAYDGLFRSV